MADQETEVELPPEEAFAALGEATRIEILRALAGADGPLSFSTLRERVGAEDSGGFNYHLSKLLGRFVRKSEGGYELTTAGMGVYGAIISGTYTDSVSIDPIALGEPCPHCETGDLELTYGDERMRVACVECGREVADFPFPPAGVEGRDRETLPEAFDGYLRATLQRIQARICPLCTGPMAGRLAEETIEVDDTEESAVLAVFECDRCGDTLRVSPGALVLSHPLVVAFYADHGVDIRDQPIWRLEWMRQEHVAVVDEDPLTVRVDVTLDDETLTATIETDLDVAEMTRE